jgi:8-oxo-dGTP diphosphatase
MKLTTLLFLRQNGQILLAMKKRGFGVGKWNGVGGKLLPNETILEAAIRECEEEILVTPNNLKLTGEIHFFDLPDVEHYCYVYTTKDWEGKPQESEEMKPKWFAETDIPYTEMWPDDKFWMPMLLADTLFKGSVVIENNLVRTCDITEVTTL